jgi:hypothetical protein
MFIWVDFVQSITLVRKAWQISKIKVKGNLFKYEQKLFCSVESYQLVNFLARFHLMISQCLGNWHLVVHYLICTFAVFGFT